MSLIDQAIALAAKAHEGQYRKSTDIPYISHPFAVGMLLQQAGCSIEVVCAGILHDTVEDTEVTLQVIENKLGTRVAQLVEGSSEIDKDLSWEERKQHTLEYLHTAEKDICMVVCADKLHNIRSIAEDVKEFGEQAWSRFNRDKDKQEWYYLGLVNSLFDQLNEEPMYVEFRNEVHNVFGIDT